MAAIPHATSEAEGHVSAARRLTGPNTHFLFKRMQDKTCPLEITRSPHAHDALMSSFGDEREKVVEGGDAKNLARGDVHFSGDVSQNVPTQIAEVLLSDMQDLD